MSRRALLQGSLAAIVGVCFATGFALNLRLNPVVTIATLFGLASLALVAPAPLAGHQVLSRWMLFLYCLPALPLLEHFGTSSPDYARHLQLVAPLTADPVVVDVVATTIVIGLAGMWFGLSCVALRPVGHEANLERRGNGIPLWSLVLVAGVPAAILPLTLPGGSILGSSYAEVASGAVGSTIAVRFSGFPYLVYVLVLAVWLESEATCSQARRRNIRWSVLAITGYLLVAANLMKGGRGITGLIVALAALWATEPVEGSARPPRLVRGRLIRLVPLALLGFALLSEFEAVRSSFADQNYVPFQHLLSMSLASGTWLGPLGSLFGLADTYLAGRIETLWGETYGQYFGSLAPSVLANGLDLQRSISDNSSPSWWFVGYTVGGLHPTVVPFVNFGSFGVLAIMAAFGFAIGLVERWATTRPTRWRRLVYGAVLMSGLHWFWYGDMYIIRALMAAAGAAALLKGLRWLLLPQGTSQVIARRPLPL